MLPQETIDRCRAFIGRTREVSDTLAPEPAHKLATLLDRDVGPNLPLCWHWAYFNRAIAPGDVGHDGHERLGLFLPDVPLPRRMWAAGDIETLTPLEFGVPATRLSTIEDVAFKDGRTGDLCFVTVRHEIEQGKVAIREKQTIVYHEIEQGKVAIREKQTIVYRHPGQPEAALRASDDPVPEGYLTVPDTTLVAYSAITQNGHRIHWDRDFCRDVEKYPDLVVHGPLLATLLADTFLPESMPCRFTYRATAPVFETSPFCVRKTGDIARIERSDGVTAVEARIS